MKKTIKKILNIVLILIATCLIGYSAYNIYTTLHERYQADKEYDKIKDNYVSPISKENSTNSFDDGFPKRTINTQMLLSENSDYIGWIYYKDANLDLPIVQESSSNINYYITHTFDKQSNPSGCLFLPSEVENIKPLFSQMNTFIYGHNMKNGSMFGGLKKVYNNPQDSTDPYFYIWDKDERVLKYRVIACYITSDNSEMYSIPVTENDYNTYINKALQRGTYNTIEFTELENEKIKENSPIVTLSTCYGSAGTTKRLLVQGIKILEK